MNGSLRILWGVAGLAFLASFAACGDDDDDGGPTNNPPTITLTVGAVGTAVAPGSTVDINWTVTDDGTATIDLSYTADGVAETTIASDQTGTSFTWTVPDQDLFGVSVKAVVTDDASQTATATSDIFAIVPSSARGYVTASVCENCHQDKYDDLFNSGHPFKLNKVTGGVAPTIPNSPGVPSPPPGTGLAWSDISYMIGGYGWKARFMDSNGYILVTGLTGVPVQYNLPDQPRTGLAAEWVDYHASDTEPKPYTCGGCHTTGWLTTADNGGVNQDGLEGILGTWEETGIRCEECHGAGASHVATQNAAQITVDPNAELCGGCHFRDTNHNILAKGGFIRHHEQYDELINGGKSTFSCTSCHEPHIGVRYGNAAAGGIVQSCEDCHTAVTLNHLPIECESCHMARASKSARAVHEFEGDVRTHIFTLNTDPVGKSEMFFVDPGSGNTHTRGFMTLDFACYGCHDNPDTPDPETEGGGSARSLADLSARAMVIHQ